MREDSPVKNSLGAIGFVDVGGISRPDRLLHAALHQAGRSRRHLRNRISAVSLGIFSMGTAREEIINLYDTLPARYNLGFCDIEEEPESIAKGMFGPVHKGRWGGRGVAVKKFDMQNTDHNFNLASKEMSRMIRLRHQNVLKVYGFYFVAEGGLVLKCSMVMELMDCDLYTYIEQEQRKGKGRGLSLMDDEVVYIIAEIARGMKHVHENGYLHRDLKPQNVLMRRSAVLTSSHPEVKIADFGSSELMSGGRCDRTAGTLRYKAPEQFDGDAALRGDKMDVYSFGCLCFKLWTGKDPPFKNHVELMELWKQRRARSLPDDVALIITQCLDIDPDARPGFSKISGNLDAVLKERQLEQVPHREDVTHEEAADLVVSRKIWKRFCCLVSSSTSPQPLKRRNHKRQWIVEALGLDHGVDGLDYADYVIPSEELDVRRRIRSWGSETAIYEVNWKGTLCALKVYGFGSESFMDGEPSIWFKMLPTLIHDNIVRFLGYSLTTSMEEDRVCPSILMEYLPCDLCLLIGESQRIRRSDYFPEHRSWMLMKGIAEGMKFLHGKDWVHGDLKPANIMLNLPAHVMVNLPDQDADDIVVKLIDFNLSNGDALAISTRYAAPEVLQARRDMDLRRRIDYKKADVYSFAITCSDILGEDTHFGLDDSSRFPFRENVMAGMRPMLPEETMPGLRDLITRCWSQDPAERPSFCDICEFFLV